MSSSRHAAIVVGILSAGLLAACGFQLRGAYTYPESMQRTYIDAPDNFSLFYREFRRDLRNAGVDIVESPEDATAVFRIFFDDTNQRVLSVSARNTPTEYEVYYTIQYGLVSGNNVLLDTQELTKTQDYTYDETLVLGKAREEQVLREAIVRDLVDVVLKQISTL